MTILHVTDFHFNKPWFEWLLRSAPSHDLLVMSGDMLNHAAPTPHRRQRAWVADWIRDYPGPMCICSGNHDLDWDAETERWTTARWLRDAAGDRVWTDGQRVVLDGLSILTIGCASHPKGAPADIWVVHAPPAGTLVASRATGGDGGDPDLVAGVERHKPRVILSGHVHDPVYWRQHSDSTLYLNPGYAAYRPFPNHILLHTSRMNPRLITAEENGPAAPPAAESRVLSSITPP